MHSLVIGLGIGQLYKSVFQELGYTVDSVDANPEKNATFKSVDEINKQYDIAVICTPNFTHEDIARKIAKFCKIILIEKPGVVNSSAWKKLVEDHPDNRIMMVKNNQYRAEIDEFRRMAESSTDVYLGWYNKNRIPNPGSWFTTKKLAFGGVSRDLLPHMLSYYTILSDFKVGEKLTSICKQRHSLANVDSTDYGVVNKAGTFDVDDFVEVKFSNNQTTWHLNADWKDDVADDVFISFASKYSSFKNKLGLCPESAYKKMIETAVLNLNNNEFWSSQFEQDFWIHQQIENL